MACISEIKKYLRYEDGRLRWADKLSSQSATSRFGGKIAGDLKPNGYWYVGFQGKRLLMHRVIFAIHHGWWPEQVDHIDGNPKNNKVENLRASDSALNKRNAKRRVDNKTGYSGVSQLPSGSWRLRIGSNHLGCYSTKDDALVARAEYMKENGYSERHGVAQ